ncbi:MAG: sigma 54-interacting transcriptional regulator [Fusobacterium perfoetens]|uniref:sigma-54 interaction domain-containing protein n=1 Tax=Fusobacterium perfoetens TaxID=852 RepID=UPI0023F461E9|nr:sigma 54-interacting transcriptional regulator [Fusobacterium perfoetens]MCI6153281.1 sigma 54-interacting transcriptional regulator [Fusobacterium perfoetens]MDY3238382.1 sigma 54-interacting transcriptional regulator [Fusobacterium perfoetens]
MKKIVVITCDKRAGTFHANHLKFLLENKVEVYSEIVANIENLKVSADLFCITTDALEKLPSFYKDIAKEIPVVILHVTFSKKNLEKLKNIPKKENVLLVNLNKEMAQEAITSLIQLGLNQFNYIPFYPGANLKEIKDKDIKYAITPDEERFVPSGIENIINIGQREVDNGTLVEIALKLKMYNLWESQRWKKHLSSITSNSYNFDELFGRSLQLELGFQNIIDILEIGVLGVNEEGKIFISNKKAEGILKQDLSLKIGEKAEELFPFLPFDEFKNGLKKVDSKLIKIDDNLITISIYPINYNQKNKGFLTILQYFKEEEEKQQKVRNQLLNKGHVAKYTFSDIIGISNKMINIKKMAEKMSKTKSPILITGESGTGKELFAQSIHNSSERKNFPFIALNCGALPENLLESELFGYVDGAFTGAKRGGKMGFFEFAHNGTLFLDEIEGMTPLLQLKLLRVIQEKEFMRLGDTKLISIDVRIIAATNRDLEEMMLRGEFREDLYYRLSTLQINIPPLRERPEDIFPLIEAFSEENKKKLYLSSEVKKALYSYYWRGNIRELRNYIDYFFFLDKKTIEIEDLPSNFFKEKNKILNIEKENFMRIEEEKLNDKEIFVLEKIKECNEKKIFIGREKIYILAKNSHLNLSFYEIRKILEILNLKKFIEIKRGKIGNTITMEGKNFLNEYLKEK